MRLSDILSNVRYLCQKHGWHHTAETRSLFLTAEAGELAREIVALHFADTPEKQEVIKAKLGREMHDVIWNIVALADIVGIDLEQAMQDKMNVNEFRVWQNDANKGLS